MWKWETDTVIHMKCIVDGMVYDISKPVAALGDMCSHLLSLHALIGCYTVSYPYGNGKANALTIMKELDLNLEVICDINAHINDVLDVEKKMFKCWYGCESANTLNDARATIFRSCSETPNIRSLSLTVETYKEHGK